MYHPDVLRPRADGGCLDHKGMVEVASSLTREGEPVPYDIRQGVWVVFEGDTDYLRNCFQEYKVKTDPGGRYTSLYKRWHLIGLELPISVASVGLRGEPTGVATTFNGDVVGDQDVNTDHGTSAIVPTGSSPSTAIAAPPFCPHRHDKVFP